ncbi:MAG: phosphoserine transaminase [Rhodospirillaceae bacterium]|nr:phosphoserine transaminase [Rhodospirillaceae bacterium]|tara:strand:- start:1806 stop:2975 length:1170 start_codon:yes stop_codon:yes gene_type:complete
MKIPAKPDIRPDNPNFSSGPCSKRPGWSLTALEDALVGRSHRAKKPLARIREVISLSRKVLGVPENFRVAIVPASDTGAIEMAMWSLLGQRGVDFLTWENFGEQWVIDGETQLKPLDYRIIRASYGKLPDLSQVDPKRDCVFVWNGTTSGVRVPNGDWISSEREGLTICDATSGVLAHEMPWEKLDVVTYSWQKALGGEAGFGMLLLGPRATERLENFTPPWPVPKIFRIAKGQKIIEGVFRGATINTVSMLAIEDVLDALRWVEKIGGGDGMIARATANFLVLDEWVAKTTWVDYLARDPATRSRSSVCLRLTEDWFQALADDERWAIVDEITTILDREGAAYDIATHRAAAPGLRIWSGGTVEASDLVKLLPWLDWAWSEICSTYAP